jgi:hypothetical protein
MIPAFALSVVQADANAGIGPLARFTQIAHCPAIHKTSKESVPKIEPWAPAQININKCFRHVLKPRMASYIAG